MSRLSSTRVTSRATSEHDLLLTPASLTPFVRASQSLQLQRLFALLPFDVHRGIEAFATSELPSHRLEAGLCLRCDFLTRSLLQSVRWVLVFLEVQGWNF